MIELGVFCDATQHTKPNIFQVLISYDTLNMLKHKTLTKLLQKLWPLEKLTSTHFQNLLFDFSPLNHHS